LIRRREKEKENEEKERKKFLPNGDNGEWKKYFRCDL
jgi:hypothetical protein